MSRSGSLPPPSLPAVALFGIQAKATALEDVLYVE
jgi:hypothetical protein